MKETKKNKNPATNSNWLSHIFFCWQLNFFVKESQKFFSSIKKSWQVLPNYEASKLGDQLETIWTTQSKSHNKPSLWLVLFKNFGKQFLRYSLLNIFLELFVKLAIPILLRDILKYFLVYKKINYFSIAMYIFVMSIRTIGFHNYFFNMQMLGMKIKIACSSLIYRKTLQMRQVSFEDTTAGQIVNLLSNDVSKFELGCAYLPYMILAPTQFILTFCILYKILGFTVFVSSGIVLIFIIFLIVVLVKVVYKQRKVICLRTDQRVQLINEIINGIKVIKMYAWEKPFAQMVTTSRNIELKEIKVMSHFCSIRTTASLIINRLAIFGSVMLLVFRDNKLTPEYVFVLVSFLEMLRQGFIVFLPTCAYLIPDLILSAKRIEKFLQIESSPNSSSELIKNFNFEVGIEIKGLYANWCQDSAYVLSDINFALTGNEFATIIGPVGSGKTSLLLTILKELNIVRGSLNIKGRISYASQVAWIMPKTIKENILFGEDFIEEKYRKIISICELDHDFLQFPHGDATRGVALSGGQKARINLARCLYKDADIYMFDDPFASLDSNVGQKIFKNCILTYLKEKSVILVTQDLQHIKQADKIYFVKKGRIAMSGRFDEIITHQDDEFLNLIQKEKRVEIYSEEDIKERKTHDNIYNDNKIQEIIEDIEDPNSLNISFDSYIKYFQSSRNCLLFITVVLLFLITHIIAAASEYFILFWIYSIHSGNEYHNVHNRTENFDIQELFPRSNEYFISVYLILIVFFLIISFLRSHIAMEFASQISRKLHDMMLNKIMYGLISFFNKTPSGQILNRFGNDLGAIDEKLPIFLLDTFQIILHTLSVFILLTIVNYYLLITSIVFSIILYSFYKISCQITISLKRLEGRACGPILSHLSSSIQGLVTIRSAEADKMMSLQFDNHLNNQTSFYHLFIACDASIGFWLDLICVLYTLSVISILLYTRPHQENIYISASNIGFVLTQLLTLIGQLQFGLKCLKEVESCMTSVESVLEYSKLPIELVNEDKEEEQKNLPKYWPNKGNIEFRNISLSYSETASNKVLENINLEITSKEKIGIVGRTGAGKSSLISLLFYLTKFEGDIIIDSINIKNVSLHTLRSKISIIPQEPFLFSDTVRRNIDPFDKYTDCDIWRVLGDVKMSEKISKLPLGLCYRINEGGVNFSVGEKQLLCLARVLLNDNKILVFDEATANIDPYTEQVIQSTIKEKFRDCTVITIAHKIHTIMDSDRIVVMDLGKIVEFDTPAALLENEDGVFYRLSKQQGVLLATDV